MFKLRRAIVVLFPLLVSEGVVSFSGLDPAVLQHSLSSVTNAVGSIFHPHHSQHHHAAAAAAAASTSSQPALLALTGVLEQYKHALASHPLQTKIMTGAVLATAGDAIAQSKELDTPYDIRRAASFGTFDMAYRALQHASFPIIVENCRGQILGGALASIFASTSSLQITPELTQNLAAMEQTLASQLGIVPFLYYPVFFALTGFMQGLTMEGSIDRAKEKFLPLMQRNLLFWIPVQFIQFGFIEENLQIPFLSVCGLAWTFILSIMAGSTKTYKSSATQAVTDDHEDVVVVVEGDLVLQEQLDEIGTAVVSSAATVPEQPEGYVVFEQR